MRACLLLVALLALSAAPSLAECEGNVQLCPLCHYEYCNERCVCWCKYDHLNCPPQPQADATLLRESIFSRDHTDTKTDAICR